MDLIFHSHQLDSTTVPARCPTLLLLVLVMLLAGGCDARGKKEQEEAGHEAAPWVAALASQRFTYRGLVENSAHDLNEVALVIDIGIADVGKNSVRLPVTVGYEGPEQVRTIKALLYTPDSVEHRLALEGDSSLPSPGAKRALTFTIPGTLDANKIVLDLDNAKIVFVLRGTSWTLAPDEAAERYDAFRDGSAKARALCEKLAGGGCHQPSRKLVDSLVRFEGGDWQVTYCPERNCFGVCERAREIAKGLGSSTSPWLHADDSFCVIGPHDRAKVSESAISQVKTVVAAPLLADH